MLGLVLGIVENKVFTFFPGLPPGRINANSDVSKDLSKVCLDEAGEMPAITGQLVEVSLLGQVVGPQSVDFHGHFSLLSTWCSEGNLRLQHHNR